MPCMPVGVLEGRSDADAVSLGKERRGEEAGITVPSPSPEYPNGIGHGGMVHPDSGNI